MGCSSTLSVMTETYSTRMVVTRTVLLNLTMNVLTVLQLILRFVATMLQSAVPSSSAIRTLWVIQWIWSISLNQQLLFTVLTIGQLILLLWWVSLRTLESLWVRPLWILILVNSPSKSSTAKKFKMKIFNYNSHHLMYLNHISFHRWETHGQSNQPTILQL